MSWCGPDGSGSRADSGVGIQPFMSPTTDTARALGAHTRKTVWSPSTWAPRTSYAETCLPALKAQASSAVNGRGMEQPGVGNRDPSGNVPDTSPILTAEYQCQGLPQWSIDSRPGPRFSSATSAANRLDPRMPARPVSAEHPPGGSLGQRSGARHQDVLPPIPRIP